MIFSSFFLFLRWKIFSFKKRTTATEYFEYSKRWSLNKYIIFVDLITAVIIGPLMTYTMFSMVVAANLVQNRADLLQTTVAIRKKEPVYRVHSYPLPLLLWNFDVVWWHPFLSIISVNFLISKAPINFPFCFFPYFQKRRKNKFDFYTFPRKLLDFHNSLYIFMRNYFIQRKSYLSGA